MAGVGFVTVSERKSIPGISILLSGKIYKIHKFDRQRCFKNPGLFFTRQNDF
jgi:hypothetical protein